MQARLTALDGYKDATKENDCFWILQNINSITLQFDDTRQSMLSLLDTQAGFLNCKQQTGQTTDEYVDALIACAETIESHGGAICANPNLVSDTDPITGDNKLSTTKHLALACPLTHHRDCHRASLGPCPVWIHAR